MWISPLCFIRKDMGNKTLMFADGAAFGAEIEKMMKLLETNKNLQLYLPESFDWLILKSGLLEGHDLENMLKEPYLYIDSEEDFSWERYFAKVLISRTSDTYLTYMKSDLNPVYLQQTIQQKILQVMNHIEL